MNRISKVILIFALAYSCSIPISGFKLQNKDLSLKYKKWLEEDVLYLITPKEKEVFLQLETDDERTLFIESFWKHRDPTSGTPENEFKVEHYRRLAYTNENFSVGSSKPGWITDRGRIYIILGEPVQKERYTGQRELRDTEIWFYQDIKKQSLPPAFHVVFVRKGMGRDYELYRPVSDGPRSFFNNFVQVDPDDSLAAYMKLSRLNSAIAEVSLSLVPGDQAAFAGHPSLASEILLQSIQVSPHKEINDLYAEKLLEYKGIVEVEYSANYIYSDYLVKTLEDGSGIFFVHYLIEPQLLSVSEFENTYYAHFIINGRVDDSQGKLVYQFEKEFPLKFDENKIKTLANPPIQLSDMFPLIPGNYKLSILIKNTVSKEFSSFSQDIIVPERITSLQMGSLLLAYSTEQVKNVQATILPFQIGQELLFSQPNNIFHPSDKMTVYFQLFGLSEEIQESASILFTLIRGEEIKKAFSRRLSEYKDPSNILEEISLLGLPAADYTLKISVQEQSGKELLSRFENFSVTPVASLSRPALYSRDLPASNDAWNYFIIGSQYYSQEKYDKAIDMFEKALHKKPGDMSFTISLAKTYFIFKRYDDMKRLLVPFLSLENAKYEIYFLLGKAAQAEGSFIEAAGYFQNAISHFGLNIQVLNELGECYFKLNNLKEAEAAWEKSLKIYPNQPQIKENLIIVRGKK